MESIRNALILISVSTADHNIKWWQKVRNKTFCAFIFISLFVISISSAEYFLKFFAIDIEMSLYAMLQVSAFSGVAYTIAMGFIKRNQIDRMFKDFDKIRINSKIKENKNSILIIQFTN